MSMHLRLLQLLRLLEVEGCDAAALLQVAGRDGVWLWRLLWLGGGGMYPDDMDADRFVPVTLSPLGPEQGSYRKCGHFFSQWGRF